MEPVSRVLNEFEQCEAGKLKRNHLIFIDDIKLIAKTENELHQLESATFSTLNSAGFILNQDKSCTNSELTDLVTKQLDSI